MRTLSIKARVCETQIQRTKETVSHRAYPTAMETKTVTQYIVMFLQIQHPTDLMGLEYMGLTGQMLVI